MARYLPAEAAVFRAIATTKAPPAPPAPEPARAPRIVSARDALKITRHQLGR